MPPSVDATFTHSPCVPRSTPKRRNTRTSKLFPDEHINKKSRSSSSLSETSPRCLENLDMIGQITQESQKNQSSPNAGAYINVDFPPNPRQNDGFLKGAKFCNEGRGASEALEVSIRSMILHLGNLVGSISVAYEKERDLADSASSSIITELAQLRTSNDAVIKELAQLRISNESAAADNAKLKSENANLAKKEAATFSKLDELRKQCATRDAVNLVAAFVMSKALFLQEKEEMDETASSEIRFLHCENAKILSEAREVEEKGREQILQLQSAVEASVEEITKLRSDKEKLIKEKEETEATTISATQELGSLLVAANEEVKQLRSETEALLRNLDDAAARADAAPLELDNITALEERAFREIETTIDMRNADLVEMAAVIRGTTAEVRKIIIEKEEIARQKVESKALADRLIVELISENAALGVEKEKTSVTVDAEFKKLRSRYHGAVEELKAVRQATGLEKEKLKSVIAAKTSELVELKRKSVEVQAAVAARDAQRAAEVDRLSREKAESHAREAALLETLRSISSRSHLAFLFNCGHIRPEHYNLLFK